LFFILRPVSEPLAAMARYLSFINVFLGAFNLLPGFPMDGGRVLRSIIWKFTGNLQKSTRIASAFGQGFAFVFIALGFLMMFRGLFINGIWIMMIGWFLYSAAGRGYHQIIVKEMLSHVRAQDLMETDVQSVSEDLPIQKLVDEFILKHRDHAFIVADRKDIKGIIGLDDVKKIPRDQWPSATVKETMIPRKDLMTVSPDDDGNKVLAQLTNKRIHQVPVVKDGKIRGIVSRTDILHFLQLRSDLGI